ncbi:MAG TPA: hypothetical protein VHV80_12815 [Steroidobacteraceae bacterium]|jgi:hypothetical protein|nr:hypothetical protein [Steroidobacteraceae bacterium]
MTSERPSARQAAAEVRRRDFLCSAAALSAGCLAGSMGRASAADAAQSASHEKPFSRQRAADIIADARKIVTPNGIERLEAVRIGGIEQWVSVRGMDKRNPVLLFFHGGPGYISIPMSWWYTRGLGGILHGRPMGPARCRQARLSPDRVRGPA